VSDSPDELIELKPDYCNKCGCSLESVEAQLISKRQVVDIPPVQPVITEYRNYQRVCPKCGRHQHGSYPAGVNTHIQYGANVEAAIAYLSVYQYMPFKRLKECLEHFFNVYISEGSIANILERMKSKSLPIYERIKDTISSAHQIGSDETSAKVNGKNWWIWVWQTRESTFLSASDNRGSKTINDLFPDGFERAVLNSDRWAAQLKTVAAAHQLCVAHLLRDMKYLAQLEKHEWINRIKDAFKESLKLKAMQPEYNRNNPMALQMEQKLDLLLKEEIPKTSYPKTHALQESLKKLRESIFTFLYNNDTESDNNASERAIRNVKVKQKISGQFKTGQNNFCVLRSIIDTCLKKRVDVMFALSNIAQFASAE